MGEQDRQQHVSQMTTEQVDESASQLSHQAPITTQSSTQNTDEPPFHSQYTSVSDPSQAAQQPPSSQYNVQPQAFSMSGMAGALPEYASPHGQPYHQGARPIAGASTPAVVYQLQQNLQYLPQGHQGHQGHASPTAYGSYGQAQYPAPYGPSPGGVPGAYGGYYPSPQRSGSFPQSGAQFQQAPMQYYYYQDPYGRGSGSPTYSQGQFPPNFRPGLPSGSTMVSMGQVPSGTARRQSASGIYGAGSGPLDDGLAASSLDQQQGGTAIPRGPPRKPKQSGHALWVGNLPPGATITDLKDHFSRDAMKDIESLFLISKSNCAFVNYRSESACQAAMQRFHDSRFQGVRLVCRLRRSSAQGSGVPSGPSSMSTRRASQVSIHIPPIVDAAEESDETEQKDEDDTQIEAPSSPSRASERYFIVKSLTVQDLEQSVRNGIWATQSHNEEALNKAYKSADNVYLIFSANKSGEYFGYARMASSIAEDATQIFGTIQRTEAPESTDAPRTIVTPATETAPRGRIIDDSARGTIFWEAELTDEDSDEEKNEELDAVDVEPQTWGKPFKIEWLSTSRLPFYRTRGLRNPWNANREVKIARDGTELEPSVGKRLVQLFHRAGSGPPSQPPLVITSGGSRTQYP